jgi:putative membrane protein insertion efficiency factor
MIRGIMLGFVRFYRRFISPLLPSACRFEPTCSRYALEAIEMHGAWSGGWLILRRLLRCQPFSRGGFDPVPVPEFLPGEAPKRTAGNGDANCHG